MKSGLAFVALGSNLGDPRANVRRALRELRKFAVGAVLESSLWETAPLDCPPGSPRFINAAAGFQPRAGETPESLLAGLKVLEKEFGRLSKQILNEPRPLDLDLIAFAAETRVTALLILPHPRAHLRRFVLQPLGEIAPALILPGQSGTVSQLLETLPPDGSIQIR